jgi:hypothetical protein
MEQAKGCLEKEGYHVVGGFLSPSHELYVRPKCKHYNKKYFETEQRLALIDLTLSHNCASLDWISSASWESSQKDRWPDFPEVVDSLAQCLHAHSTLCSLVERQDLTVFYAAGLDHFQKCGAIFREGKVGTVVVSRGDEPVKLSSNPSRLLFMATNEDKNTRTLSSTQLQVALQSNQEDLSQFLPFAAQNYLKRISSVDMPGQHQQQEHQQQQQEQQQQQQQQQQPKFQFQGSKRRRKVFISLSYLLRDIKANRVSKEVLESDDTLFFFGSKRYKFNDARCSSKYSNKLSTPL